MKVILAETTMPKHRVTGRGDPYRNYLEDRQFGFRRHGVMDRLYKRMADDMLNMPDRFIRTNFLLKEKYMLLQQG